MTPNRDEIGEMIKTAKSHGASIRAYVPAMSQFAPKIKVKRPSERTMKMTKGKMLIEMRRVWIYWTTVCTPPVRFISSLAF